MPRKMARQILERHAGACYAGSRPYLGSGLLSSPENRSPLPSSSGESRFNGKRGTSAPACQFGWQGRAGRGLSPRTGMRRDQPANALLARVGRLQSQFRLRLFGVETLPHGQHKTGSERQNHNQ